jgi:hypothetical protein
MVRWSVAIKIIFWEKLVKSNNKNLLKLRSDGSRLELPRAIIAAIEKSVPPFELDVAMLATAQ